MTERSGERPGVYWLPVGALTGALGRIIRAVPLLHPSHQSVRAETRPGARDEEQVMAAIYYYRSGKVHVTRKGKP